MPHIQLDENQRQHLLWFARAHNGPAWFIAALERAAPPALPLTRWRPK